MTKKIFAIKLSIYIAFGLLLPIGFLSWKFELFSKVTTTSASLWGVIAIVTAVIFVLGLFNGLKKGMKEGLPKQVINTICSITIPLIIFAVVFDWMSDFSKEFTQFLVVLVICETAAGVVNPLPQWKRENDIEDGQNLLQKMIELYIKK